MKKLSNNKFFMSIFPSIAAIIFGLVIGFITLIFFNPSNAVGGLVTLLTTGFSEASKLGNVFSTAAPLLMTGLAVGVAYKCGLFNIGAAGQFLIGGFAAVYVGIVFQAAAMPNAPFVEIGWRISSNHWRKGYALEAAQASLKFAFETLAVDSVYTITNLNNLPSIGVMKKLGMKNQDQDFDHPALPKEHPLARHCLYGITRDTALFK